MAFSQVACCSPFSISSHSITSLCPPSWFRELSYPGQYGNELPPLHHSQAAALVLGRGRG